MLRALDLCSVCTTFWLFLCEWRIKLLKQEKETKTLTILLQQYELLQQILRLVFSPVWRLTGVEFNLYVYHYIIAF